MDLAIHNRVDVTVGNQLDEEALQILCQASFKFSPSLCLKLRISCSGVIRRTSHNDKVNDLTREQTEKGKRKREEKEGKRKREEIGKERANKMARGKWGRGKREVNGN